MAGTEIADHVKRNEQFRDFSLDGQSEKGIKIFLGPETYDAVLAALTPGFAGGDIAAAGFSPDQAPSL